MGTMKTTTYAAAGWRDARQHTRHACGTYMADIKPLGFGGRALPPSTGASSPSTHTHVTSRRGRAWSRAHTDTHHQAQPEGGSSTWVQIARHRSRARTDQQPAKLQCKTAPAALSQGATTTTTPPMLQPGPTGEEYRTCGPRPPPRSTRWKQHALIASPSQHALIASPPLSTL